MQISLAPMQGYTDAVFRSAISRIGGIDIFYAPYMKIENGEIRTKYLNDISRLNNVGINLVPQVLTNKAEELIRAAETASDLGYGELNWNLGCPYPMATKRRLGAGLLPYPEIISEILDAFEGRTGIKLSVKMRLGLNSDDEIWKVIDVLNKHKISEIILHPRIAKQMYKGEADKSILPSVILQSAHPVAYNGDIRKHSDAQQLISDNPQLSHFMIGRGLLFNPLLAKEIKGEPADVFQRRSNLHKLATDVAQHQLVRLQGEAHFVQKMTTYWEYWSHMFVNQHKVLKTVKKCRSVAEYDSVVQGFFANAIMVDE